ncbi:hypothetical protein ACFQHO_17350 [Actinomadura yumaensis]|uniref:hypothetical protein n=1 Tax=Actinomadura yumaensis TaxID=111807 RepID=UPI00360BF20B
MPDAAYDVTYGDPDARRVREELDNGLYGGLRDLLRGTADPDARAFHVAAATERAGRPAWLDAWVAAEPRNPDAHLVRARTASAGPGRRAATPRPSTPRGRGSTRSGNGSPPPRRTSNAPSGSPPTTPSRGRTSSRPPAASKWGWRSSAAGSRR